MNATSPVPLAEPSWEDCRQLLDQLPRLPVAERVTAFESLVRSSSPEIRGQALHLGGAILSDGHLIDYLANDDDAVLRNAGLEILKMRGGRSFSTVISLLEDANAEVALQAVLILDHLKDPRALEPVRRLLSHPDPNVVSAALAAIGHLGDARAVADLIPFVAGDPWLQMSAIEALGDLRSPEAVPHLGGLLTDLMVGPMVAEALARIGGQKAFEELASHWLRFSEDLEAEVSLGLLAHILEGLEQPPAGTEALRRRLTEFLADETAGDSAARCLLALGPGAEDDVALDKLASGSADAVSLPPCLRHRGDLIGELLGRGAPFSVWGFLLAGRLPAEVPHQALVEAVGEVSEAAVLPAVAAALAEAGDSALDGPLLDLYLRLAPAERGELVAALVPRRKHLLDLVSKRSDLGPRSALVLRALLGEPAAEVAVRIEGLSGADLDAVVGQILDRTDILRQLPWESWLDREPDSVGALAATVAARCQLRGLLPRLRQLLVRSPGPEVIRALGELGDRDSVPGLVALLSDQEELRPLILKSLGEIGGGEAREALRSVIGGADATFERLAYRALSQCATEQDEALFREAIEHSDWNVRLASAEVLGRSARVDNLGALARLVADPVSIVSQRAMAFLEP